MLFQGASDCSHTTTVAKNSFVTITQTISQYQQVDLAPWSCALKHNGPSCGIAPSDTRMGGMWTNLHLRYSWSWLSNLPSWWDWRTTILLSWRAGPEIIYKISRFEKICFLQLVTFELKKIVFHYSTLQELLNYVFQVKIAPKM